MDVLLKNCAGLDVHQKEIAACVIREGSDGKSVSETRSFPTMTKDLYELLKWLEQSNVTHVAMESTGIYWKPIFNIIEDFFDITLANAPIIKNVLWRKTVPMRMDTKFASSWAN